MKWRATKRSSGLIEWECEHGVGHPDLPSAERIAKLHGHMVEIWATHGCDGCCNLKDFPGEETRMPRARLEFDLPEEQSEFELATKARGYASLIHELWEEMRKVVKYGSPTDRDEYWYKTLNALLDEYKIDE